MPMASSTPSQEGMDFHAHRHLSATKWPASLAPPSWRCWGALHGCSQRCHNDDVDIRPSKLLSVTSPRRRRHTVTQITDAGTLEPAHLPAAPDRNDTGTSSLPIAVHTATPPAAHHRCCRESSRGVLSVGAVASGTAGAATATSSCAPRTAAAAPSHALRAAVDIARQTWSPPLPAMPDTGRPRMSLARREANEADPVAKVADPAGHWPDLAADVRSQPPPPWPEPAPKVSARGEKRRGGGCRSTAATFLAAVRASDGRSGHEEGEAALEGRRRRVLGFRPNHLEEERLGSSEF
jgi:hypothetical protein